MVVVLPDLSMDDAINTFILSLKLYLKELTKGQAQLMTNESLNEVMTIALKLKKKIAMVFRCYGSSDPSKNFHYKDN